MNACFKISTTLSVLFALAACAEKPAEEPAPEKTDRIESDSPSLSFSAEESTQTFTLTANCDWQLAQVVDWFHASPASGKEGQTVITVRADANPTDEVRSAPLYAKAGGKALTTVIVTQLGKSEPEPEPEPGPEAPVADLLDIIFHPDGTAQDVSPSQMKVETIAGAGLSTYYNESFQRVVAHFANDMGKTVASGYYKIDYAANSEFRNRIADSHSWEAVVRIDADPAGFGEIKMFSCHQSGGTGFLISKAEQGNHLSFITHTGAWNWAESDIVPAVGRYYHLLGVFDAAGKKTELYVDGELKGSATNSTSTFQQASANTQYVVVGGDPGSGGCTNAWLGDIVLARIYDKALTAEEVKLLYERDKGEHSQAEVPILSNLQFLGECAVTAGMKYHIYGNGFMAGDQVRLQENATGKSLDAACSVVNGELIVTIPNGIGTGLYSLALVRQGTSAPIGTVNFTASSAPRGTTKVVAHRGAYKHTGAAQNSIASLKAVKPLGIYGSELDVWITPDDVVVVNHDATFPTDSRNRYITDTNYSDMGDIRLSNGEAVPTLDEYVRIAKQEGIRLIIEIKTQRASANGSHTKLENNNRVVDASIAIVKKYGYEAMCDWIAFDFGNCKRIAAALPSASVQYLNGDYAPATCFAAGVNGIDYKMDKLTYAWMEAAHTLGMVVNVWTVDSANDMLKYIGWGVDLLTTNEPELAKELTSKVFLEN